MYAAGIRHPEGLRLRRGLPVYIGGINCYKSCSFFDSGVSSCRLDCCHDLIHSSIVWSNAWAMGMMISWCGGIHGGM